VIRRAVRVIGWSLLMTAGLLGGLGILGMLHPGVNQGFEVAVFWTGVAAIIACAASMLLFLSRRNPNARQ